MWDVLLRMARAFGTLKARDQHPEMRLAGCAFQDGPSFWYFKGSGSASRDETCGMCFWVVVVVTSMNNHNLLVSSSMSCVTHLLAVLEAGPLFSPLTLELFILRPKPESAARVPQRLQKRLDARRL